MTIPQISNETVLQVLKSTEELHHLKDVDAILDKLLLEARRLNNADAGSIFLVADDKLKFSYVHNDTLFNMDEANAALYVDYDVPISHTSIVGYVAATREILSIDDAYHIPDTEPYKFNPSYDWKSGYRTTSILTIPLKSFQNKLVGVMQLINAKDEKGQAVPFSPESRLFMPLFANNATLAIERGIMNRELILRMMKMAELKDPSETGAHVLRVGAYSAEIYQRWAHNKGMDNQEIKRSRDLIRLASMLHDVGKVGITDLILKKPARLTPEEFQVMQWHTVFGARLFVNTHSGLDEMSREIALCHHEKWDGTGYPGHIPDIFADQPVAAKARQGEEIPLPARITSLADVFDALTSKRSYKEPWPDEKIMDCIESDSGTHFDPEVVEAFFQIFDVIKAIREKFKE